MDIHDLAAEVGETPRQIRYLIAERCMPGPGGSRSKPEYGEVHVSAVRRFQSLRSQHRTSEIRALLVAEQLARDGGRIELAPGVSLSVDSALLHASTLNPKDTGAVVVAVLEEILKNITSKDTDNAA